MGGEAADAAVGAEPDAEALRRDVLTGHLLALATEDGLPRHALPALAASLQAGLGRPAEQPIMLSTTKMQSRTCSQRVICMRPLEVGAIN